MVSYRSAFAVGGYRSEHDCALSANVGDQGFTRSGTANLSNGPAPQVRWTTELQAAHPGYKAEPHTSTKDECRRVGLRQGRGLGTREHHKPQYGMH
jgi:hypothetical protein